MGKLRIIAYRPERTWPKHFHASRRHAFCAAVQPRGYPSPGRDNRQVGAIGTNDSDDFDDGVRQVMNHRVGSRLAT